MRDAAGRGTQAETRDRKRKLARLSLSFSLSLRGKSKELPHSGAGDSAPRNSPSVPAVPLSRGEAWEERAGKAADLSRLPPCRRGWAGARPAGDPAGARGSHHPLSSSSFPPALHLARLFLARLLCARRAHCTQGALWSPDPGGSEPRFPAPLPRGGRPGSGLAEYFVNCVSGIRSGVPPWLAVGFSPCPTQPLPSVTCRRFFPRRAGSPRFVRQQQGGEYL